MSVVVILHLNYTLLATSLFLAAWVAAWLAKFSNDRPTLIPFAILLVFSLATSKLRRSLSTRAARNAECSNRSAT